MSQSKKFKRKVIGSVCKSQEPSRPDYIKIRDDVVLKKGVILRLESKAFQLKSMESAVESGKLPEATGDAIRERLDKIPEWVRFEVVLLEEV